MLLTASLKCRRGAGKFNYKKELKFETVVYMSMERQMYQLLVEVQMRALELF